MGQETIESSVLMLAGLPGAGKTTLASALHRAIPDSVVCSLDDTRRALGHRDYRPERNIEVFDALYDRVQDALAHDVVAIVDANHTQRRMRAFVYQIGRHYEVPVLVLECVCEPGEARRRITARARPTTDGYHEGNEPGIHDVLAKRWQPIEGDFEEGELRRVEYLRVRTDRGYETSRISVPKTNERLTLSIQQIIASALSCEHRSP